MVDWSEFPEDLLLTIFQKLNDVHVVDSINFSRVCRRWGTIARDYLNQYVPYGAPCLMIPGTNLPRDPTSKSRRILASPVGKDVRKLLSTLPQVMVPHIDLCRGSHQGWLVMIKNNLDMYLENPFSNRRIDLPSITALKNPCIERVRCKWYVNKAFLSTSPTDEYTNCCVLIFYEFCTELAFYKLGDTSWKYFHQFHDGVHDAIYFKGQWHILAESGQLYIVSLNHSVETIAIALVEVGQIDDVSSKRWSHWLAQSGGELVKIKQVKHAIRIDGEFVCPERHLEGDERSEGFDKSIKLNNAEEEQLMDRFDYDTFNSGFGWCSAFVLFKTYRLQVYKLETRRSNAAKPSWIEVDTLGGDAMFVGLTQSFSITNPQLLGYKRNHIYFTDRVRGEQKKFCRTGYDVGIFNLENSTCESLYEVEEETSSMRPPALWVIPRP